MQRLQGSMDPIRQSEIGMLQQRLDAIERRSGLMSPSFWTRAFSVFGYLIAIQVLFALLLGVGFMGLLFLGMVYSAIQ